MQKRLAPQVNSALNKPSYKCGCFCNVGVQNGEACGPKSSNPNVFCRPSTTLSCQDYDSSKCGIDYSYSSQAAFCAVPSPSHFPEFLPVRATTLPCHVVSS